MDQSVNFVACLSWIKRGIAKSTPDRVQLTKEDLQRLIDDAKQNIKDAESNENDEEEEGSDIKDEDNDDVLAKYNLDQYDDDSEKEEGNPLMNIAGLAVFASSEEDPYITLKDVDDDSEDEEDFQIRPEDNLIVVGRVEEDCSVLEVYVYNEEEQDLYVHHDMILPAFPLAIEWLNFDPSEEKPGNYVAVGDMTPVIQVWDIDVVDAMESSYSLGKNIKKKKKSKSKHYGHTDAVLDLSWNKSVRQALASGSADYKVLIWDLHDGRPVTKFSEHREKVQTLVWHPCEPQMLLTGGCDRMTKISDCRSIDSNHRSWTLDGEVEKVIWNHFNPFYFLASTDQGTVHYLDARTEKPVYMIKAHHEPITGLSLSLQHPGCLVTASTDSTIKIWDVKEDHADFVAEKNYNLGSLHALSFSPDSALLFAVGGDNRSNNFKVCDIRSLHCASRFTNKEVAPNVEMEECVAQDKNELMNTDETTNNMENLRINFSQKSSKPKKKFRQFKSKRM